MLINSKTCLIVFTHMCTIKPTISLLFLHINWHNSKTELNLYIIWTLNMRINMDNLIDILDMEIELLDQKNVQKIYNYNELLSVYYYQLEVSNDDYFYTH
jgi:hypothetical protein